MYPAARVITFKQYKAEKAARSQGASLADSTPLALTPSTSTSSSPVCYTPDSSESRRDSGISFTEAERDPLNGTGPEALNVSKLRNFRTIAATCFDNVLQYLHAVTNSEEHGQEMLEFEGSGFLAGHYAWMTQYLFDTTIHRVDLTIYKDAYISWGREGMIDRPVRLAREPQMPALGVKNPEKFIEEQPFMNRVLFLHLNLTLDIMALGESSETASSIILTLERYPRVEKALVDVHARDIDELKADERWIEACRFVKDYGNSRGTVISIDYHVGSSEFFSARKARDAAVANEAGTEWPEDL